MNSNIVLVLMVNTFHHHNKNINLDIHKNMR